MNSEAWYLHCKPDDVGEDAVIVGDRGRVLLARELLDNPVMINEDRGLTTVTGTYRGKTITVSAFGMGAPIAAVVVDELAQIGVRRIIRLGTVMSQGSTELGDFVLAYGAIRNEGTSRAYLPLEFPAVPDFELTKRVEGAARATGRNVVSGIYDSEDGFYTHMMNRTKKGGDLEDAPNIVGTDMETSAVFIVGTARGVATASLCLASVDGSDYSKLAAQEREAAELELLEAGFNSFISGTETGE
jgi:uridine phosphorylase